MESQSASLDAILAKLDSLSRENQALRSEQASLQDALHQLTSTHPRKLTSSTTIDDLGPNDRVEFTPIDPVDYVALRLEQIAPFIRAGRDARSEKLADPELFYGDRSKTRAFLLQITQKLKVNCDRYESNQARAAYVFSRLGGKAVTTMEPFMTNGHIRCAETLIRLLSTTYDDANRENTALAALQRLRQTNKSFPTFYSEFLAHVSVLGWNESAKVATLRAAISSELQQALVGRDIPQTMNEFATLCLRIEEDLQMVRSFPRPVITRPGMPQQRRVLANNSPTSFRSQSAPDPMDLDAAIQSYAPANSEKRQRYRNEKLCFGCGKPGHIQRFCPTMPFEKVRSTFSVAPPSTLALAASKATDDTASEYGNAPFDTRLDLGKAQTQG
jgi:hypothetical protein